jgi:hypothetical protein
MGIITAKKGGYMGAKPTWKFADRSGVWSSKDQYTLQKAEVWPKPVGKAMYGGYFAGYIKYGVEAWSGTNGEEYMLIIAPKSLGEAPTALQYKTSATCNGYESNNTSSQSSWDGYHNTYYLSVSYTQSPGTHPAAEYVTNLTIGGSSLWYIPSSGEMSVLVPSLKQHPWWQQGGAEQFTFGTVVATGSTISPYCFYWTSRGDSCENTGTTGTASNYQPYGVGLVFGYPKTDQFFVRAIRRIAYPTEPS